MALGPLASFRGYVLASLTLTTIVISHAIYVKRFFYRTVVYLSSSKFAILAVGNMALVLLLLIWRAIQAMFLGPLRFREVERLHLRAREAIIECCFAMTIFREEFNARFLALVTTLLLVKSLHWLARDRVEFLEEQPLTSTSAHARLVGLLTVLLVVDSALVMSCGYHTFKARGPTMLVLFAFEFTVLLIDLMSCIVRYVLHAVDMHYDGRWDAKGLYSFYNELLTDMCQLTVYILFFFYVQLFYTFPLHIIRDLYLTFNKFQRRCVDFLRYRRVVATMNELFPDATEEELSAGDRTCIICREEMREAKKLNCAHMFHARCLQSWLKRQLTCPTCRSAVDVSESAATHNRTASSENLQRAPDNLPDRPAIPAEQNPNDRVVPNIRANARMSIQAFRAPQPAPAARPAPRGFAMNDQGDANVIRNIWQTILNFIGTGQQPGPAGNANVPQQQPHPPVYGPPAHQMYAPHAWPVPPTMPMYPPFPHAYPFDPRGPVPHLPESHRRPHPANVLRANPPSFLRGRERVASSSGFQRIETPLTADDENFLSAIRAQRPEWVQLEQLLMMCQGLNELRVQSRNLQSQVEHLMGITENLLLHATAGASPGGIPGPVGNDAGLQTDRQVRSSSTIGNTTRLSEPFRAPHAPTESMHNNLSLSPSTGDVIDGQSDPSARANRYNSRNDASSSSVSQVDEREMLRQRRIQRLEARNREHEPVGNQE